MKRSFQNVVILFALMVVFNSCGDGWKKYIPLSVDKELGIQAQNQYDLMYKNQILPEKDYQELYNKINFHQQG